MYSLTLTAGERAAIDAIGNRYANGVALRNILIDRLCKFQFNKLGFAEEQWNKPGDVTFTLREYDVWDLEDISAIEDHVWPCFNQQLTNKMKQLVKHLYGDV